jgi:5'-nucleotidase
MKKLGLVTVSLFASVVLMATACGGDDGGSSASNTTAAPGKATTTTAAVKPLRILVTNDDGVGADGISALVDGLSALPDTEVVVVAPATNQSGTGGKTTPGALTVTDASTKGGHPAKAVAGYPADTIVWAVEQGNVSPKPDLVISGINLGQNLGPATKLSGTVGAATKAAELGLPALAVSQGLADSADFPTGVKFALEWLKANRDSLKPGSLWNLNIPTCGITGTVRGQVEVPLSPDDLGMGAPANCSSTLENPKSDAEAFENGFVPLTKLAA